MCVNVTGGGGDYIDSCGSVRDVCECYRWRRGYIDSCGSVRGV